jgi:hypothetical protein
MAKHRKHKRRIYSPGRHRVVSPKRDMRSARRAALAFPIALTMVLYPATVGDGEGKYVWSPIAIRPNVATAGEVIPETSDGNDDGSGVDVNLPGDE